MTFFGFSRGKSGRIFFRPQITRAFFRPRADRVAKIEQLVAVNLRARPAGFGRQNIGELVAVIEQQIAQPVKYFCALSKARLLPGHLSAARALDRRSDITGRGNRHFRKGFQRGRVTDDD